MPVVEGRRLAVAEYAIALGCVAAATAIRLALDPLIGTFYPFATLFVAVLVSAWLGGLGPGLLASTSGAVASIWFLLPPRRQWSVDDPETLAGLALYLAVSVGIAAIGGRMRRARRSAEDEASEAAASREELRVTLHSIGDAVITADVRGRVTSLNAVAAALTGWSVDTARGRPLEEVFRIVDEQTHQPAANPAARALSEDRIVGLADPTLLIARDGTEKPIDDSAAPIRDRQGAVTGVVLVFRDVTERRRVEDRIRRSEKELSDFFENANVGLHQVGPDGIIVRANRAELEMLGYEREEYVGRHIADFHVDADVIEDILARLAAGEKLVGQPARMRCKDGSIRDVLINSSVHWEEGRFVHTRCFTLDVTAQKRAAEAQALLAAVVESSEDAIVTKTLDGIITSWNSGAERLFGYTRDEAVGRSITLIIPPERHAEELEFLARLRRGERIEPLQTVRVDKAGRLLDISLRISPIRDDSGRIIGASKVARDITAALQAERRLRESEERFSQVVTNAPAAIFIKDLEGRYTLANPLARDALGRPDTVLGLTDHELLPREVADALREADRDVIATGRAIEREEVVRRDGYDRRYLTVKFPLVDASGSTVGVCGVAIDITDRQRAAEALRESEQRFGRFMEHLPGLAWIKDLEGRYIFANAAAERTFRALHGELYNLSDEEIFPPETAAQFRENDRRALASEAGIQTVETLQHDDGSLHYCLVSKFPIPGPDGRVGLVGGIAIDITERIRAEEALKTADRRKDEFLAMLAHELRNPLAPLRSSLEIMDLAEDDAEAQRRARATIERQAAQLERLVDDLLDIARISRDRLELRRSRVELTTVVEHALEACRPLAESKTIALGVELPAEPIVLDADPVRLAQAFGNLLGNACKYTAPGGRVSLEARREGEEVRVAVRDTGRGIPREMLLRVFDLFTQLDPAGERASGGSGGLGIGLSLVRRLVELHGGTVEVFSEGPGRGSEFVVRLPLVAGEVATQQAGTPAPAAERFQRRRVLVVDDNADAAESLGVLLQIAGHEVAMAHDGETALKLAESCRPEVVLLDIGLPGISGYEVARRIREQPWGRDMTLVALTGWGQEEDRRRSREAGFDRHLVKPVDRNTLRELLTATPGSRPEA